MAQKMSTGLCNQLLDTGCLKDIFDLGFIKLYSGSVPATADASIGGATLQVTISNNGTGTGLTFDTSAADGTIGKNPAETWSGTVGAGGNLSFYRVVAPGDTGGASTTEPRIQGTIGTGGADMNLGTVTVVAAAPFALNYFTQSIVPS